MQVVWFGKNILIPFLVPVHPLKVQEILKEKAWLGYTALPDGKFLEVCSMSSFIT